MSNSLIVFEDFINPTVIEVISYLEQPTTGNTSSESVLVGENDQRVRIPEETYLSFFRLIVITGLLAMLNTLAS